MIIDDADQVDRVHPLQLKREDVDLPHRVRTRTLEATHPRRTAARLRRRVAQPRVVDHRADLLRADLEPFLTPQIVTDPAHAVLRILPPPGDDLLLQNRTLLADGDRRRLAAQPLNAALGVVLPPLVDRAGTHADQLADLDRRQAGVQRLEGQDLDLHGHRR